ncbi:cytidylyltransferase domain-containing protein [Candidatus Nitrosotenuis cloacae]|uniref:acylneuraminate cytidylyltransferase family protein n=1 Tax=Candidatus Nitrosotenuis cloacae TaxID=1603555 RepID=UPI002282FAD0|nr:acylneuraminate cytidylyltransferase family protein [Candidatus Nitrosotenuis cloacae]
MKSICFIAARGGSKGIPRKNIRKLGDKPLIAHSIETALNSNVFDHVIVSTEDKEIASISKRYGAEVPFMRPNYLARDKVIYGDVVMHALKKLHDLGYEFDVIASRDCTVPFIDETDLRKAMNLYAISECDGVHSVCRAYSNPYFGMYEPDSRGYLHHSKRSKKCITARQDSPIVYQVNGLYINSRKKLLKTGDLFAGKILPCEISQEHGIMIDDELQFKFAQLIHRLKNHR